MQRLHSLQGDYSIAELKTAHGQGPQQLPLSPGRGSPCWPHSRGFCPWKGEVPKESPEAVVGGPPTQKRAGRSPPSSWVTDCGQMDVHLHRRQNLPSPLRGRPPRVPSSSLSSPNLFYFNLPSKEMETHIPPPVTTLGSLRNSLEKHLSLLPFQITNLFL